MRFHISPQKNNNRYQRIVASLVLSLFVMTPMVWTSTAMARTVAPATLVLQPGILQVRSTAVRTTDNISYKQKVVLARQLMQVARANKKSLSFISAMRQVNKTLAITPTTMLIAKANLPAKKTTPIPVLNSAPTAPVISSGGGGGSTSSSTTSTTTVATPAPVTTTVSVPVSAPAPVTTTVSSPVTAPVVVAPTAPAPVAPVVVAPAPTAPAPTAPVVVAPTAPATVAPVDPVVAPTAPAPVATPTGTTPINIVSPQDPNLAKLAEYQKVM